MKKIALIFLLILYVTPTFGFNLSMQFCCGQLSSISFEGIESNSSMCESTGMKKGCCKDIVFCSQISHDQLDTQQIIPWEISKSFEAPFVLPLNHVNTLPDFPLFIAENYFSHPPVYTRRPLYILQEVFRI